MRALGPALLLAVVLCGCAPRPAPGDVERYHRRGIQVVPWTVNDVDEMRRLIEWGVDGIITDRPDLLLDLLR